ncbi:extracellular solute-binding protein [Polymorphospora sp. NPDC051019]|uniref:extracellular solute-binding protein n=1 Tax=Polymorphospora sp. NPDC051019 TaxID=3155725 RepID=UPI0034169900
MTILSWRLADPGALGQLHQSWIDSFNASQSAIKVTGEPVPFADKGTKLVNTALSGSAPDIVAITTSEIADYANYLLPVDEYWQAEGAEFAGAFTESARNLAKWDGRLWGVPIEDGTSDALYYNKKVLAEAGVDVENAVSSWANFRSALQTVKASGKTPMVFQGKDAASFERHWAWYVAGGVKLDDPAQYVAQMCSPQAEQTFAWLTALYTEGGLVPNPSGIGYDELTRQFAAGDVGFVTDGPWGLGIYEGNNPGIGDSIGVTRMPPKEVGGQTGANQDALIFVIPKNAKNPRAAWEFIKYMSTDKAQEGSAEAGGFVPTRTAVFNSPTVTENELLSTYSTLIEEGGFVRPRGPHMAEMRQILITAYQAAVTGQQPVDRAFQSACNQLKAL